MDKLQKKEPTDKISDRPTLILNDIEAQPVKQVYRYCIDRAFQVSQTNNERSTLIVQPLPESKLKPKPALCLNNKLVNYFESLTKEKLWQELFNRLLRGKVGRLYLKSARDGGSVVCFENGVAQVSLDKLDRDRYQYLIQKLKALNNLPETPLEKTKKFEMQRWYKEERILLCSQIEPGRFAEEGTLQILRGKALEFYQQQQIDELAQEALKLSKQLEYKLKQIQLRSRINPQCLNNLAQLRAIEQKINQSLNAIEQKMNSEKK